MEIVQDFNPSGSATSDNGPGDPGQLHQLEGLVDLYQNALGHDLPNQLVSVQGFARLVEAELPATTPSDVHALLGRVATLARKADEQMRALAALGRLVRPTEPAERIDLGELVREATTQMRLVFKALSVDYHFSDVWPVVTTPRAPLYRVLLELLRNSYQAAGTHPSLVLAIEARRDEAGHLILSVRDNGRGLSEFQLRQVETMLAGRPGGSSGLGLVLVRLAVAGWNGAVRIQSEPAQGTTVTLLARTLEGRMQDEG